MTVLQKLNAGDKFRVRFPFVMISEPGPEGVFLERWKPGCNYEPMPPDDFELVADDEGEMILTVVDVHKPGNYPARVFYTRDWIDPCGVVFGSGRLQIATVDTFKRRTSGYYYEYRLKGDES